MKAGILYTGSGPILVLTSYESLVHPELTEKLEAKGIRKYIAYEVEMEAVKTRYGNHFEVVMEDLHQEDDLRIMDYDGHHVFNTFSLNELGSSQMHEPGMVKV
jgi:hypothetical protein